MAATGTAGAAATAATGATVTTGPAATGTATAGTAGGVSRLAQGQQGRGNVNRTGNEAESRQCPATLVVDDLQFAIVSFWIFHF